MRTKTVKLSKREKEKLDDVRKEIFKTDEVPYGEVINTMIDENYDYLFEKNDNKK